MLKICLMDWRRVIFSLKCVLIKFTVSNLSLICIWKSKSFKPNSWNRYLSNFTLLNLCVFWNSQSLFCRKKLVLMLIYQSFLFIKMFIKIILNDLSIKISNFFVWYIYCILLVLYDPEDPCVKTVQLFHLLINQKESFLEFFFS